MSESLFKDDVHSLDVEELSDFLESKGIEEADTAELVKRKIDGKVFLELSREDIAAIFPDHEKFVLGMRLYKIIQNHRDDPTTQELLADLSDQFSDDRSLSTNSGQKRSPSCESSSQPKRRKTTTARATTFALPLFSLDIERCIKKDAFYTGPQRNKLIREACTALYGYCRQQSRPVTVDDKKDLALRLYKLAPKSLGDPGDHPEKGLYGQIIKWYQNHTSTEKKSLGESSKGKRKKRISSSESHGSTSDDDEEGIEMHLKELLKEAKKKRATQDIDKIVRLQSITTTFRLRKIEEFPSASRAQQAIEEYPFLMRIGSILLDMFHCLGQKCSSRSMVLDTSKALCHRWYNVLMPAILRVAEETKLRDIADDATYEAKTTYCLEVLLTKLKPKSVKDRVKSRMNAIICFADSVENGLAKSKENNDPYILAVGEGPDNIESMVIVCKKKVITEELGRSPFVGLLVLIAVHYVYKWEFNSGVKEVLEFVQEKLLQDPLPRQKQSIAYTNLYRVVSCFEIEIEKEVVDDQDLDATQLPVPECEVFVID